MAKSGSILVVQPASLTQDIVGVLNGGYEVTTVDGIIDAVAALSSVTPELIVIHKETDHGQGVRVCHALRKAHKLVPILFVGDRMRRSRDQVEVIASGADDFLDRPEDGRLLKMKVDALLQKNSGRTMLRQPDENTLASLKRESVRVTNTFEAFYKRIQEEVVHSADNHLSFVIVRVQDLNGGSITDAHVEACAAITRQYDTIYPTNERIAVLLAETGGQAAITFRKALSSNWKGSPMLITSVVYHTEQDFKSARLLVQADFEAEIEPRAGPIS